MTPVIIFLLIRESGSFIRSKLLTPNKGQAIDVYVLLLIVILQGNLIKAHDLASNLIALLLTLYVKADLDKLKPSPKVHPEKLATQSSERRVKMGVEESIGNSIILSLVVEKNRI